MSKKTIVGIALIGMVIGASVLYFSQWSMKKTSTTEFCVSCHSMDTPLQEWQGSLHYSNQYGIRAGCADCHIPHEGFDYLKVKVTSGLKDVIAEIRGTIPDQQAFEEKRGEMAKHVWSMLKENDSATCRSCHNSEAWDLYEQPQKAMAAHQSMDADGKTCIDCHRGIAHFPPEFTGEANAAAAALSEQAHATPTDSPALYPITRQPMFADPDSEIELASILPTTQLNVVSQKGDWREVEINGYRQPDAEQVLYAAPGKRIILALLPEEGVNLVQNGTVVKDSTTGTDWTAASLRGWVKQKDMLGSPSSLWQYGQALNDAYCGGCHSVIQGEHFTANQWPSIVNGMADRTSISDSAKLILTYYLQYHSKDMEATHE